MVLRLEQQPEPVHFALDEVTDPLKISIGGEPVLNNEAVKVCIDRIRLAREAKEILATESTAFGEIDVASVNLIICDGDYSSSMLQNHIRPRLQSVCTKILI